MHFNFESRGESRRALLALEFDRKWIENTDLGNHYFFALFSSLETKDQFYSTKNTHFFILDKLNKRSENQIYLFVSYYSTCRRQSIWRLCYISNRRIRAQTYSLRESPPQDQLYSLHTLRPVLHAFDCKLG